MSYDISLVDPISKKTLTVENNHFMTGGTYCVGGTNELWLNVTYNYANQFRKAFNNKEGIHLIEGKNAIDTIPMLEKAIANLSDDTDDDYWKSTEGNAKRPLVQLLTMAKMRPDGIWEIC